MLRRLLVLGGMLSISLAATAQNAPATSTGAKPAAAAVSTTAPTAPSPVMPPAAVQKQLGEPATVLLDVRTPAEFASGHVVGARNLDFRSPEFAQQVAALDPKQTYVLYCASGNRSGKAAALMQEKGFKKVVNAGAFTALKEGGLKTE